MTSSCLRWAACQLNCITLFDPMQSHTLFMGILPMALYRTLLLHSIKHTLQMMSRNLIQERTKFGHVSNGVLTKSAKIYYLVSCILINCHTCLYGSQSTTYLIWSCHPWKPIYPTRDHVYLVFLSLFWRHTLALKPLLCSWDWSWLRKAHHLNKKLLHQFKNLGNLVSSVPFFLHTEASLFCHFLSEDPFF